MKRDEFDSQLNSSLLSAEKLIPEKDLPDLPYMELAPTVHDWYDFEHELVMRSFRNVMRTVCVMQTSSVMRALGACVERIASPITA